MGSHIKSPIKPTRLKGLPLAIRLELKKARLQHSWSQQELGERTGLPQMHISGIETGKIVPRFDTLLDLVRVLDRDLVMVPRALVPAVSAIILDHEKPNNKEGERPLYADDVDAADDDADDEDEDEEDRHGKD